jgi:hypothetical protein
VSDNGIGKPDAAATPARPTRRAGDQDECANNRQTPRLCGCPERIRTLESLERDEEKWNPVFPRIPL